MTQVRLCNVGPREPRARGSALRNGGFLHGYWASLASARSVLGDEDAVRLARAAEAIVPGVRSFAEQRGEDVRLREAGMLMVSAAPAQDDAIDRAVVAAAAVGHPEQAVALTREEVAARCASPAFRHGVFFRDGATIEPGLLVRALRRAVIAAGVTVHEHTPLTRIRGHELTTPGGVLRAPEIVLATNAALSAWRPASRSLTNFGSYVVLTEPAPDALEAIGWTGGEAIVDGRMFLHYFRTTSDGRVLMGSGSGPIGFAGRVDDRSGTRIHYGAGYSGHGVGPSWLGGRILASLALGADDEWTKLPLVTRRVPTLPPEPLRRIGSGLVRSSIMAVEESEEQERRPPLVARAGAALPKLLGMELGTR